MRVRSLMPRTPIALKFKMCWFPDEASYRAEKSVVSRYRFTSSYACLMTSRASQEYSAPGSCWKTKIYLYLFCIYINNNNI